MKPVESPAPAKGRYPKLRVLQPLPPKRRCKASSEFAPRPGKNPDIIYLPAPVHRPLRLTRSGQPFQVWKEPQRHEAAPAKPEPARPFREVVRAYSRTLAFLLSWRGLHHTP